MRSIIAWALALALLVPAVALADSETASQTIRVLVRTQDLPHTLAGTRESTIGWVRLEIPIDGSTEATVALLAESLDAEVIVERRYSLLAPAAEPFFPDQWSLENTGQTGGASDADIDANPAWGEALGAGIVVAVIDSGIDESHIELSTQMWQNPGETTNGLDDDGNGFVDDVTGWDIVDSDGDPSPEGSGPNAAHGTMVAGIIASAVNGVGITGVAPESRLMNLRACTTSDCWSLDLAEAIHYAVDEGADLINFSIGAPGTGDVVLEEAIDYALLNEVLVVAAAGNDGKNIDTLEGGLVMIPAGWPHSNILSVAATDDRDQLAKLSNYGPTSVDVAAPGLSILTTGTAGVSEYVLGSGTSFSAPIVSGIAALLLSSDPGVGFQELIARIEGFADDLGSLQGLVKTGRVNAGTTLTKHFVATDESVFAGAIDIIAEESITQGCNPPFNHKYCPDSNVTRGEMAVFLSRTFDLPNTTVDYFTDDDGKFYEGAANRMAAAGITVGCAPELYCGELKIPRGQMAAMLSRALDLPDTVNDFFSDDDDSIFEEAINRIAEAGITKGCNPPANTKYCPGDLVTRGQMAGFLRRTLDVIA